MAEYVLKKPHYFEGRYLEAGEKVQCDPEKKSMFMEEAVAKKAAPESPKANSKA